MKQLAGHTSDAVAYAAVFAFSYMKCLAVAAVFALWKKLWCTGHGAAACIIVAVGVRATNDVLFPCFHLGSKLVHVFFSGPCELHRSIHKQNFYFLNIYPFVQETQLWLVGSVVQVIH